MVFWQNDDRHSGKVLSTTAMEVSYFDLNWEDQNYGGFFFFNLNIKNF